MITSRPIRAALAALSAVALTIVGTVGAVASDHEPVVVLQSGFEDGSAAPWQARGGAGVTVVDTDAHTGSRSLAVEGRTANWHGVQTDLAGTVEAGQVLTVSGWITLLSADATTAKLTLQTAPGGTFTEVTAPVPVDSTAWVQMTGTVTVPAGQTSLVLYVEADSPTASFLVDDLLVTRPAGGGTDPGDDTVTITSLDFDAESIDPWTPSGSPALGYVDADGGKALSITRAADFEGIQSPTGLLAKGVVYTFTMRAKLPDDSPLATTDVRFVVKPAFTWVGNATVTKDAWTTVTGEYTVPGDLADLSEVQVYLGSADQGAPYTFLVDDLSITAPAGSGGGNPVDLTFDFEDATLQGWEPRDAGGNPTVSVTDAEAHESTYAALVSDRAGQGDGIRYDVSEVFEAQVTYEISAWVKMAAGEAPDTIWLSMQRINAGADSFDTVGQFSGITATGWTQVTASYTMASADTAFLYFETSFNGGGAGSFLIDDVTIRSQDPREVQDLTPLKDTVPFPLGVAIDSRETTGSAAQLTLLHFNQLTAENHMKVEAWYDGDRQLRMHPEAVALMDFARANDLTVYGHVLAWHSQTPAWFFQDAAGQPLTTSEADKALMRQRLNDHIDGVAQVMAERYGPFGSDTNPLVAWDVVNEVVADTAEHADGLRRSEWYRILGEEFIDLAFRYADEAFNGTYAAPGADRPVTLFINDYNTEQAGKQSRYYALVSRLVARGVPIDGVGHQFHVSLSTPVGLLDQTLRRFDELGLVQVVTELDVTVGTPVTQPNLIEQGYYYRDAFNVFRAHADKLYSVTVWGLDDARSWRSEQAPLLFDGQLQAKPAYYGAAGAELPARILAELSFGGDVPLGPGATADPAWDRLPLIPVEGVAAFQTRWAPDHLTVYVRVTDATDTGGDSLTFVVGDQTYTLDRSGSGVPGSVAAIDGGWAAVVHLPLNDAARGDTVQLDVQVTDAGTTTGWNTPGSLGTLTLVEELSFTEVVQAPTAPTVDGVVDDVWELAAAVSTDTQIEGSAAGAATAEVRTLWSGDGTTLYVLAEVTDDQIDLGASNPWEQDSVEIFLDAGNVRNGPYRYDDTQIRINVDNVVSFGTGDETFQANRLTSATSRTETGYLVEAAISLLESGGPGSFHGFDVQVNDGTSGARTSVRTWADPTGLGYQNTSRWGVAQLVEPDDVFVPDPKLALSSWWVRQGDRIRVDVSGYYPGEPVTVTLRSWPILWHHKPKPVLLGTVTADAQGSASAWLEVPRGTRIGLATITATQGELSAKDVVVVVPKHLRWPGPWRPC